MESTNKLKVGDKVRFFNKNFPKFVGMTGNIRSFHADGRTALLSSGNLFQTSNLELAEDAPKAAEYIAAIHATLPEDPPKTLGVKFDQLKARWSLVPRKVMAQVVEVLTFGAAKYSADNWMHVDPEKYYNALHRHVDAWRNGEKIDEESGKHHLAHALCCLLFMLWHDDNPKDRDKDPT